MNDFIDLLNSVKTQLETKEQVDIKTFKPNEIKAGLFGKFNMRTSYEKKAGVEDGEYIFTLIKNIDFRKAKEMEIPWDDIAKELKENNITSFKTLGYPEDVTEYLKSKYNLDAEFHYMEIENLEEGTKEEIASTVYFKLKGFEPVDETDY